jgi:hypothetical protein
MKILSKIRIAVPSLLGLWVIITLLCNAILLLVFISQQNKLNVSINRIPRGVGLKYGNDLVGSGSSV